MEKGLAYLKRKLEEKRRRVLVRYNHYEMKALAKDFDISTPPQLRNYMAVLGWCGRAVDSLADRLVFREFENDNLDLNNIFRMNNMDVLCDSAIVGALISSCDFIYIAWDDTGFPIMQVIDGSNATGVIDPTTNMLKEGYAVLERDEETNRPTLEAYFLPGVTHFYPKGEAPYSIENDAPYPLLVPIIFKPDAKRPFGHSRISRACINIVNSAARTVKRSEISAEFFSFPQKYALGTSEDLEMDKWSAAMSAMLNISKDEDGDRPVVGQFQQASQTPHLEQLKSLASLFAGETGLTMDDLGFVSDNPSSAEAIKAAHETLRLTARSAQRTFGSGFLNAGYLAACIRDQYPYNRRILYMTKPKWEPLFEPDSSALALIGDGAIKINQAIDGYLDKDNLRDLTGIEPSSNIEE